MSLRNQTSLTALILLAALAYAPATYAAPPSTTSFNVTATVDPACVVTATNLAFGPYLFSSATALDGSSTVSVNCMAGTPYEVQLSPGNFPTAGNLRRMKNSSSADYLFYQLYTNFPGGQRWGDTTGFTVSKNGIGAPQPLPVYGRIFTGQNRPAGGYQDTISVTVLY